MDGRRFGPYVIGNLLGRGGMGEVYRAYDTVHDRDVALKLLPAHLAADPEFRERFARESRIAARLGEPHVVPIHAYGELDGTLYIDMRLIDGRDLAAILARDGAPAPERAVALVEQVAQALDGAHANGLLHRDVKPANILVGEAGGGHAEFAYVVDFGISRSTTTNSAPLTGAGATVGTVGYMAPERFLGHRIDHRVDVYSLACVLHECLTAQRPFPRGEFLAVMYAHLHEPPPRPSLVRPGVPPAFDAVVARGMAKEPDRRYPTCNALAADARAALDGRTDAGRTRAAAVAPPPTAVAPAARARRPRGAAIAVAAGTAVVLAAVAWLVVAGLVTGDRTGAAAPDPGSKAPSSADVPTGALVVRGDPAGLALSPDGSRLYVSDLGSGVVQEVDTHAAKVVREISVGGFLHGIAVTPDGSRAYVAAEGTGAVSVLDLASGSVTATIRVADGAWLWGVAVSPDGHRVYVTSRNSGTFAVIDTASSTVRTTVDAGTAPDGPVDVAFSPDGRRAYLTDRGGGMVTVVDATTDRVVAKVRVQSAPNGVTVGPDGRVYVTNEGADTVSVIDPGTLAVVGTVAVGDAPITVVTSPDGTRAYVVDRGSRAVSVIDTGARSRLRSLPVGGDPGPLAISPDGLRLYVGNAGADSVVVLDPQA
ncbi:MAG: protein kinase [Pseudonocardia sp.]